MLRSRNSNVSIQAVNANAVYGEEHILGILRIVIEAEKRNIMIANKCETELLIRFACTDQISKAMEMIGLKRNAPGCFIAFSQDQESLHQFELWVKSEFGSNDSILKPNEDKRKRLASMLGLKAKLDDSKFLQYLLEKAAILVR
jgi:tRNA threonylcarbamoyladenosine modification (KEOPS) complex Cgi121 subunit